MKKQRYLSWMLVVLIAVLAAGCERPAPEPPATLAAPSAPAAETIAAGRELARGCVACHGAEGASGQPEVPFIAGQSTEYLTTALRAYTTGERRHTAMRAALAPLKDGEIALLAAYYASLDVPWKAPARPSQRPVDQEAVAAGKARSSACSPCHGNEGHSTRAGVPSLAGLRAEYFKKALGDYLNDKRENPLMEVFKHALSPDDIRNLTAYYGSLTPQKTTLPAKGDAGKGKAVANAHCAGCHGVSGTSMNPAIPSLVGHDAQYLTTATRAYRDGLRDNAMMKRAVAKLSDGAITDVAAHYASQSPLSAAPVSAAQSFDPVGDGARLSETCAGCHGENGNSALAGTPSLSRLHPTYLSAAIAAYQQGTRAHSAMKSMVEHLSPTDIEKLGFYYATRKPQASPGRVKGEPERGAALNDKCTKCHGQGGNSTDAHTPSLAGQDPAYLVAAMHAYAKGTRVHKAMGDATSQLSDQDILDLAAYYGRQEPAQPTVRTPEPPERLAQKCDRCHDDVARSRDRTRPRIAGQQEAYLFEAMRLYATSVRDNSAMYIMTSSLSELEMRAIAKYYAQR